MMHVFDKNGNLVACSVISVDANVVAQLKTASSDGYNAVQIGADVVQAPENINEAFLQSTTRTF